MIIILFIKDMEKLEIEHLLNRYEAKNNDPLTLLIYDKNDVEHELEICYTFNYEEPDFITDWQPVISLKDVFIGDYNIEDLNLTDELKKYIDRVVDESASNYVNDILNDY